MSEAKDGQSVPLREGDVSDSDAPQPTKPETEMGNPERRPFAGAEKLSLEVDRFSCLSSEMLSLLANLFHDIHSSAEEVNAVRAAVDLKSREIETLRDAEKSVMALEQQMEDLRKQKESLERLVTVQRHAWEAEKVRRTREEKEYDENRKILRERDEEEYRKAWADEQLKARQMLEEELSAIRQRSLETQETAEKNFLERELILKKKEQEWGQLIQELDQFLSKLAKRTHPHGATPAVLPREHPMGRSGAPVSSIPSTGTLQEDADLPEMETQSRPNPNSDEISMWENAWSEKDLTLEERQLFLGQDLAEEPKDLPSFLKDLYILQGGRIEDQNPESPSKRESAPLKFSPRNATNHKAED